MDYTDNLYPNREEVVKKFSEIKTPLEFKEEINKLFPDWLVCYLDGYSSDYKYLENNWKKLCETMKVPPQKILFVTEIVFDDDHKLQRQICEIMTQRGFVVRRLHEFIACPVCNRAIPCQELWQMLKSKGMPVPGSWSNKCRNC